VVAFPFSSIVMSPIIGLEISTGNLETPVLPRLCNTGGKLPEISVTGLKIQN
jgi:hypothetical protein